ncbi:MAG: hypothetical protein C0616_13310 [Desulfuromonas sp.]|nr:MAG: hypothetical protein C0616_13310 [Desulfuromonas sp.]
MLFSALLFIAGLLLLYYGAEYLVSGSSRLALSFGIRPLVVGMTVVAFATSMPELLVSLFASVRGSSDIAAGNIIGSNIANIGLILGAAAMLRPLEVGQSTLRRELPAMLFGSVLFYGLCIDHVVGRIDGVIQLGLLIAFIIYCIRTARDGSELKCNEVVAAYTTRNRDIVLVIVGIIGLAIGAELMVRSAVSIARGFGVSELVIGVTIVAIGTSLPELAASMVSAWKGEMELSIGNVIGSNIFNLQFVLGLSPIIKPLPVAPGVLFFELPVMLIFAFGLFAMLFFGRRLGRSHGVALLGCYSVLMLAMVFR